MDTLPEWIQILLSPIFILFMIFHGYAYIWGTSIAILIIGHFVTKPNALTKQRILLPLPIAIALLGNLLIILQNAVFLQLPQGAEIRPMMWSVIQLSLVACVTVWGIANAR